MMRKKKLKCCYLGWCGAIIYIVIWDPKSALWIVYVKCQMDGSGTTC